MVHMQLKTDNVANHSLINKYLASNKLKKIFWRYVLKRKKILVINY